MSFITLPFLYLPNNGTNMFHYQIYIDEIFMAHIRDVRAHSNFISLQQKPSIGWNIKVEKFCFHIKQATLRWSPDGIATLT